jgi:hypothetical protein
LKLPKFNDKEHFESIQRKKVHCGEKNRDFMLKTMKTRRLWMHIFEILKEKRLSMKKLKSSENIFQTQKQNKNLFVHTKVKNSPLAYSYHMKCFLNNFFRAMEIIFHEN